MKKIIFLLAVVMIAVTSCSSAGKAKTENLVVASDMADCVGIMPMKCLLIKRDGGSWEYWYNGIEGFSYEPGYEYVIKVRKETVDNPPMDASSVRYILEEVLSKEWKESEGLPPGTFN